MSTRYVIKHAAAIGPAIEAVNAEMFVDWIQATVVSSGSAGNRQIVIEFLDAAGTVFLSMKAGAVQAASLTETYTASPELVPGSSFVATNINIAIPRVMLPKSGSVRIKDSAAIDVPTDTIAFNAGVSF